MALERICMKDNLTGGQLAGGNSKFGREQNDFYATDPKSVKQLLSVYGLNGNRVLEPCVGNGSIANAIKEFYGDKVEVTGIDIVDRGYPNTIVKDFLTVDPKEKFDCIVTNPPYSLAEEFIRHGMDFLGVGGQMCMFLKVQFLEGVGRKKLFDEFPPKYVYVFRKRANTLKNGETVNPDTGKPWSTVICFAWFIWEKGSKTEPIIRWIDEPVADCGGNKKFDFLSEMG